LFMSILIGASVCQLLQEIFAPLGALTGLYAVAISSSSKRWSPGHDMRGIVFIAAGQSTKNDHARFFVARDGIGC
jgi:hypothetical protein